MKLGLSLLSTILICNLGLIWMGTQPWSLDLIPAEFELDYRSYPSTQVPSISIPGERLELQLELEGASELSLRLDGIPLQPSSIQCAHGICRAWLELPPELRYGFHDLELTASLNDSFRIIPQPRSIYLIPQRYPLCFGILSDLHLGSSLHPMLERAKSVLRNLWAIGAKFALVAGDITDHGFLQEYQQALELRESSPIPIYFVPGNHEGFGDPFLELYRYYLGPTNYSFRALDHLFLGINTQIPRRQHVGELGESQADWLIQQLTKQRAGIKLVFGHHPPIPQPEQPGAGMLWPIPVTSMLSDATRALAIAEEFGVELWVAGHRHQNYTARVNRTWVILAPSLEHNYENLTPPSYLLGCLNSSQLIYLELIPWDGIHAELKLEGQNLSLIIQNQLELEFPYGSTILEGCGSLIGNFTRFEIFSWRAGCQTLVEFQLPARNSIQLKLSQAPGSSSGGIQL